MKRTLAAVTVTAFGFLCAAQPASAIPIEFIYTGSGAGTLDDVPFGLASFEIRATADTDDRQGGVGSFWIDHATAQISIDGLGTLQFVSGTRTFSSAFSFGETIVGFSRGSPPSLDLYNSPRTSGPWDMLTPFQVAGTFALFQWDGDAFPGSSDVVTDQGVLLFDTSDVDGTFEAKLGTPPPVPEPGTLALLCSGLLAAFAAQRRRRFRRISK